MLSLYSDAFRIFFYQGSSATADVHEDIVLRFAHTGFTTDFFYDLRGNRFNLFHEPDVQLATFEYHFEINTLFPHHVELHINRIQFDYEGEYSIVYDFSFQLRPNFVINVNSKLSE